MPALSHSTRFAGRRSVTAVACGIAAVVPLGCSGGGSSSGTGQTPVVVHVVASFYPLQYVVERIGGTHVAVQNLTPTGAEPHELELTARNTAALEDADLVVYLSGFAPAVDDGIDAVAKGHALDVAHDARLDLTYAPIENGQQAVTGGERRDPHFWLDPTRLADVAAGVAARLSTVDPTDAPAFATNLASLQADLHVLDSDYRTGLSHCANTDVVTSHNAFGYLSQRYGLTQIGITGLTPEDEPTPKDLAAVSQFVEDHHVRTIYYESLVSPAIAETVAGETGATTEVLDPIEGLSDSSQGADYLQIMRADLANLRTGQGCS